MTDWLQRSELLIKQEGLEKLKNASVLVVGLGGVGSFAAEFLARAGVGNMTIIDGDIVDITNINRQLPALHSTIGKDKVEIVAERILDINPERPGHTLIIPKNHYIDINDIPIETLNHILLISKKLTTLLKEKLNYDGLRIIQNNGVLEEVKHYHLHLIPFYQDNFSKSVEEVYEILTH